jgi:Flp pilus assembly protein TadB
MGELETNWYVRACKAARHFSWLVGDFERFKKKVSDRASEEFVDAMNFTGLDIETWETILLSYAAAFVIFAIFISADISYILLSVNFSSFNLTTISLLAVCTLAIPLAFMVYLSEYPKIYARYMKIRSLGDVPEVLSYIVMSMKIASNLERSIKFAAENSERSLARDLRKLMWDIDLRVYHGIDDAMSSFADRWGKWSEHFKRSIHLIKSSTSEPDDAQRIITLNRSLDVVLEGTKSVMDAFAARLHQPTVILFSIFVMIPLALVAMLPAVTVVGIRPERMHVVLLYNILLPAATFFYAQSILMKRPAAFAPPHISDNHPSLQNIKPKKVVMSISVAVGIAVAVFGALFLGSVVPPAFPVLWGITASVSAYCTVAYYPYKKIRDEIKAMESEFSDALFVLGRRISEGKSAEDAFTHTAQTMSGSKIALPFQNTSHNLTAMHTTLKDALFDDEYGAFRTVYSDRIRATLRLFVESAQKSHEAAGVAITKLADHLKELQDVEERIKRTLYDVTSMMRSVSALFAPLIGGVTVALSDVIAKLLESAKSSVRLGPTPTTQTALGGNLASMEVTVSFEFFVLCIGLYMIFLTVILTRFTVAIEHGGDKPQFMYSLGQTLPVSMAVFSVTAIAARVFFSTLIPG